MTKTENEKAAAEMGRAMTIAAHVLAPLEYQRVQQIVVKHALADQAAHGEQDTVLNARGMRAITDRLLDAVRDYVVATGAAVAE